MAGNAQEGRAVQGHQPASSTPAVSRPGSPACSPPHACSSGTVPPRPGSWPGSL